MSIFDDLLHEVHEQTQKNLEVLKEIAEQLVTVREAFEQVNERLEKLEEKDTPDKE